jgi:hypothetical protein
LIEVGTGDPMGRRPHDPYRFGLRFDVQVSNVDDMVDSKVAGSVEGMQASNSWSVMCIERNRARRRASHR